MRIAYFHGVLKALPWDRFLTGVWKIMVPMAAGAGPDCFDKEPFVGRCSNGQFSRGAASFARES